MKAPIFRITMPSHDVPSFLEQCERAEWYAVDTGERVMTDDGPDAEAVLVVEPLARAGVARTVPVLQ